MRETSPRQMKMTCCRLNPDSPFLLWNVKVYTVFTILCVLMMTTTLGSTFDAYLFELARSRGSSAEHANLFVGTVESVNGMAGLVAALPLGYIADKVSKRKLLQRSSLAATSGVICLFLGIYLDTVPLIYIGCSLVSILMQMSSSVGQPLLAEMVPEEKLQQVIVTNGSIMAMAFGTGPLLQAALIQYVGDTWNMKQLHIFCLVGFFLWPFSLLCIQALKPTRRDLEQQSELGEGLAGAAPSAVAQVAGPEDQWKEEKVFGVKKQWIAPFLVQFCNVLTALGAGLTVKFFPLFFKQEYNFSPTAFCMLTFVSSMAIGLFVQLFQKLGSRIGSCRSALMCHIIGTLCLFVMWKVEHIHLLVVIYIVRGGIMNAKGPIDNGIVMTCVTEEHRGKWAALSSVSRVSWAGSAALGGWLADSHDYRYTFLITAILYSASAVTYLPLLWILPSHVGRAKKKSPDVPISEANLWLAARLEESASLAITCTDVEGALLAQLNMSADADLSQLMELIKTKLPREAPWQIIVNQERLDQSQSITLGKLFRLEAPVPGTTIPH